MRALLSSLALALALVLTGCADELSTDAASASSASASGPCSITIDGPEIVDAYETSTFVADRSLGCTEPVWSLVDDGVLLEDNGITATAQADASGFYTLTASTTTQQGGRPATDSQRVEIVPFPNIYDVTASNTPDGIELSWSDTFPGCDQDQADYRYSVRRLVVSGPELDPNVPFDSYGCSTTDTGLYFSVDPAATRIRYLVRTFRNDVRVSTGRTPVISVATSPDL